MFKTTLKALLLVLAGSLAGAENLVNVSWGDNIMVGSGISKLDTPEKIAISMKSWVDNYDGKVILWRISSDYLERYYLRQPTPFQSRYDKKVREVFSVFNPVDVVRAEAKKNGQMFLLYGTFLDHGCPPNILYGDSGPFPWQDKVTIAHPEYQERDLEGNWHYGVLDLSVPDARKFIIKRLVDFVDEFKSDGLYLCSRTHTPPALHGDQFGFGPNIVKEYQKRYGIDITKDPRFNYKSPEYAPKSKELDNWRKLRGEYLVTFIRELRAALGNRLLYIGLPRGNTMQAPYGNMFVDKETILRENLVDGMIVGVISGRFLYPKRTTPHKDLGYLESDGDHFNIPSINDEIKKLSAINNRVKFYYQGNFQRQDPDAGNGLMIGAPNTRPAPYLLDSKAMSAGSLKVECFVKVAPIQGGFSKWARIVSKYNHNDNKMRGWELHINDDWTIGFRSNMINASGSRIDNQLNSKTKITPGKWHHLCAIYDKTANKKSLYIDGKLSSSWDVPAGYVLNDNPGVDVIIGSYNYCNQELRGEIDELLISTDPAFTGVPEKPYTGKEKGILALWHFDSGNGRTDAKHPQVTDGFILSPTFSNGIFGKALDLTRVD